MAAPPPQAHGASNGHMQLVHRLHSADAEDAWLQREWGEILAAQNRPEEAAVHLEVGQGSCMPPGVMRSCLSASGAELALQLTHYRM